MSPGRPESGPTLRSVRLLHMQRLRASPHGAPHLTIHLGRRAWLRESSGNAQRDHKRTGAETRRSRATWSSLREEFSNVHCLLRGARALLGMGLPRARERILLVDGSALLGIPHATRCATARPRRTTRHRMARICQCLAVLYTWRLFCGLACRICSASATRHLAHSARYHTALRSTGDALRSMMSLSLRSQRVQRAFLLRDCTYRRSAASSASNKSGVEIPLE